MKKKYFIISDIHGHYDEMINDVLLCGFDKSNNYHHLLVLGDMFDRGYQSKEVLEYLYSLIKEDKASLILGNHDKFLLDFLEGDYSRLMFNMIHNGFLKTLESLVERELSLNENWDDINFEIKEKYIYLYHLLRNLPLYIEISNYIFVHGGIKYNDGNWKNNNTRDFTWSRESMLDSIPNKIVVAGHQRVATIRFPGVDYEKLYEENPNAFRILRQDGKILIDSYVEISKQINVLILEL